MTNSHNDKDLEDMAEVYPEKGIGSITPVKAVSIENLRKYCEVEK